MAEFCIGSSTVLAGTSTDRLLIPPFRTKSLQRGSRQVRASKRTHASHKMRLYSIISSARSRSDCGMVRGPFTIASLCLGEQQADLRHPTFLTLSHVR